MKQEILTAGRDLDALIAEKVMGWKFYGVTKDTWGIDSRSNYHDIRLYNSKGADGWDKTEEQIPMYSSDIAAAWEVVTQMRSIGFYMKLEVELGDTYWVQFHSATSDITPAAETQSSAPLAICLAALKAMENK